MSVASVLLMDNPKKDPILRSMTDHFDIVIVGGGLNGTVMGLAVAQAGFSVAIVDAQKIASKSTPGFDGRSYAMALASTRLMHGIGIWSDLAANAQPMLDIKVADGRANEGPSPFFMHFDHREIEAGPMGYMVEDRHLRPALLAAIAREAKITYFDNTRVLSETQTGTTVTLMCDDGKEINAQLVIAADGRNSQIAQRAGIRRKGWSYPQTALVCAIDHELPHEGVACQYFMPPGPLAILPLTGNRSSIVWSESHDQAAKIMALSDQDYLEVLKPRFGKYLGNIALAGKRFSYPLELTVAERFVAPRVALIGDAAHGVHPIAGQGLNAGLKDIASLRDVLLQAKLRGEDFGSIAVLERYQEWRRFDANALAFATDIFNKLFSNDNPILRLGRDLGMGLVNAVPKLRRSFIKEAAGLTGDLPELMK